MSTKDTESKKCPPDQILNPKTNKCVKRDGKIGKTILKKCPSHQILNPKTNRCVKRDGEIGKSLLYGSSYTRDVIFNAQHIVEIMNEHIDNTNGFNPLSQTNKRTFELYKRDKFNQRKVMFTPVTIKYPDHEVHTDSMTNLYENHLFKNREIFSYERQYNNDGGDSFISDINRMRLHFVQYIEPPHKKLAIQFMHFLVNSGEAKSIYLTIKSNNQGEFGYRHPFRSAEIRLPAWTNKINHNYVEIAIMRNFYIINLSPINLNSKINPYFMLFILQGMYYDMKYIFGNDGNNVKHTDPFIINYKNVIKRLAIDMSLMTNIKTSIKNDIIVMVEEIDKLVNKYTRIVDMMEEHKDKHDDDEWEEDNDRNYFYDKIDDYEPEHDSRSIYKQRYM